ncbi:MAG: hypothetical protein K6T78_05405 [Alicyclobacillus sp.]|nr:hypothetical protein [Alicyclobacillus sp.]
MSGDASWVRPSEQAFVRQARDWVESVIRGGTWRRTDFLGPREQLLLTSVAREGACVVAFDGGGSGAERMRALVMPDDWQPEPADFEVRVLLAEVAGELPAHGAVLGSLLGTGIARRKIGDIEVGRSSVTIAVCQDILPFLQGHWTHVGRYPVSLQVVERAAFHGPTYQWADVQVASLRLDAVLAACCHLSRAEAKAAVETGRVMLNHAEETHPDAEVAVGDVISVRRFGRLRIAAEDGISRKGRLRLHVGVLKSNR